MRHLRVTGLAARRRGAVRDAIRQDKMLIHNSLPIAGAFFRGVSERNGRSTHYERAKKNILGKRQVEVLRNLADGKTVAETAQAMGVSFHTVKNTKQIIFKKLGARSSAEAVIIAKRAELIE